jgi:hypothetical protein
VLKRTASLIPPVSGCVAARDASPSVAVREFLPHQNFIQEAILQTVAEVDFSNANTVLVVSTPDATQRSTLSANDLTSGFSGGR